MSLSRLGSTSAQRKHSQERLFLGFFWPGCRETVDSPLCWREESGKRPASDSVVAGYAGEGLKSASHLVVSGELPIKHWLMAMFRISPAGPFLGSHLKVLKQGSDLKGSRGPVRLLPAEQARKKGLEGKIVDWAACSSLAFPKPGDRAKAKEAVRPCFYIYMEEGLDGCWLLAIYLKCGVRVGRVYCQCSNPYFFCLDGF